MAFFLLLQCSSEEITRDGLLEKIKGYESALESATDKNKMNEEAANLLVQESVLFVAQFPDDPKAPSWPLATRWAKVPTISSFWDR